jgi:excisionase family DNA binding protein
MSDIQKSAQSHALRLAYRPREVAKIIGIGITRTRDLIADGRIASVRIGKCVLVTEDAIRAFLAAASQEVTR